MLAVSSCWFVVTSVAEAVTVKGVPNAAEGVPLTTPVTGSTDTPGSPPNPNVIVPGQSAEADTDPEYGCPKNALGSEALTERVHAKTGAQLKSAAPKQTIARLRFHSGPRILKFGFIN
jgi:hypothetical protein